MKKGIYQSAIALLIIVGVIGLAGCHFPTADVPNENPVVESQSDDQESQVTSYDSGPVPANRLMPDSFVYQGAFRLPDDFAWGALGLSYYPGGDGGSGSLYVVALVK